MPSNNKAPNRVWEPRFIYFIQVHNFVKIGIAEVVKAALQRTQTNCPYRAELIRSIPDCFIQHKTWLHNHYYHLHTIGEWFTFDASMLTIQIPTIDLTEHHILPKPKPTYRPKIKIKTSGIIKETNKPIAPTPKQMERKIKQFQRLQLMIERNRNIRQNYIEKHKVLDLDL